MALFLFISFFSFIFFCYRLKIIVAFVETYNKNKDSLAENKNEFSQYQDKCNGFGL